MLSIVGGLASAPALSIDQQEQQRQEQQEHFKRGGGVLFTTTHHKLVCSIGAQRELTQRTYSVSHAYKQGTMMSAPIQLL